MGIQTRVSQVVQWRRNHYTRREILTGGGLVGDSAPFDPKRSCLPTLHRQRQHDVAGDYCGDHRRDDRSVGVREREGTPFPLVLSDKADGGEVLELEQKLVSAMEMQRPNTAA